MSTLQMQLKRSLIVLLFFCYTLNMSLSQSVIRHSVCVIAVSWVRWTGLSLAKIAIPNLETWNRLQHYNPRDKVNPYSRVGRGLLSFILWSNSILLPLFYRNFSYTHSLNVSHGLWLRTLIMYKRQKKKKDEALSQRLQSGFGAERTKKEALGEPAA